MPSGTLGPVGGPRRLQAVRLRSGRFLRQQLRRQHRRVQVPSARHRPHLQPGQNKKDFLVIALKAKTVEGFENTTAYSVRTVLENNFKKGFFRNSVTIPLRRYSICFNSLNNSIDSFKNSPVSETLDSKVCKFGKKTFP